MANSRSLILCKERASLRTPLHRLREGERLPPWTAQRLPLNNLRQRIHHIADVDRGYTGRHGRAEDCKGRVVGTRGEREGQAAVEAAQYSHHNSVSEYTDTTAPWPRLHPCRPLHPRRATSSTRWVVTNDCCSPSWCADGILPPLPRTQDDVDCPLCLDTLDISDLNFKPCQCGYQVSGRVWVGVSGCEWVCECASVQVWCDFECESSILPSSFPLACYTPLAHSETCRE